MIIYKVTNLVNGKIYIGKTSREFEQRKKEHIYRANNNKNCIFYKALRKYGEDNFKWEIIDYAQTEKELDEKEIYWISFYNSYIMTNNSNGYNMTSGGEGTSGHKFTDDSKQKMRNLSKGSKNNCAKLIENDVLQIKQLIKSGMSLTNIAKIFNVHSSTISDIKFGRTWNDVGEDLSDSKCLITYSKLNENEVKEIKLLLRDTKLTQSEIANKFNVSSSLIGFIKSGKRWSHVIV